MLQSILYRYHCNSLWILHFLKLVVENFYVFVLRVQPFQSKAHITHNIFAHNIEIKRHFDKNIFFLQNIVVTFLNFFKLGFNKHNCPKIDIFNSHKKIFFGWKMSFHLFIAISFYLFISILRAKILRMNWAYIRKKNGKRQVKVGKINLQ